MSTSDDTPELPPIEEQEEGSDPRRNSSRVRLRLERVSGRLVLARASGEGMLEVSREEVRFLEEVLSGASVRLAFGRSGLGASVGLGGRKVRGIRDIRGEVWLELAERQRRSGTTYGELMAKARARLSEVLDLPRGVAGGATDQQLVAAGVKVLDVGGKHGFGLDSGRVEEVDLDGSGVEGAALRVLEGGKGKGEAS